MWFTCWCHCGIFADMSPQCDYSPSDLFLGVNALEYGLPPLVHDECPLSPTHWCLQMRSFSRPCPCSAPSVIASRIPVEVVPSPANTRTYQSRGRRLNTRHYGSEETPGCKLSIDAPERGHKGSRYIYFPPGPAFESAGTPFPLPWLSGIHDVGPRIRHKMKPCITALSRSCAGGRGGRSQLVLLLPL